jgi:peptide-methionine (R)-S-oxide reductase
MKWIDVIKFANKGNPEPDKRVEKNEEEWKALLTPEEYRVTRQKGTERAFEGEYCEAHDPGKYACRCCGTLLFDATQKFESHSGWPSFTEPVKDNVIKYEKDTSLGMTRVEVMCNVCDAHLGHVFPDGPPPTGLRFCVNSVSIKLVDEKS